MNSLAQERLRRVTSRQNAIIKELRRAFSQGELTEDGFCAIESVRTVEEAIRSGLRFKAVFFAESATARAEKLLPQLNSNIETLLLPDEVFSSAVVTETPQGVAALVKLKAFTLQDALRSQGNHAPLVVVAAGIQDPGNLGTILRSAEAFGAGGVLLGEGTVSHVNPKTVRAAAGSVFRLPVIKMKLAELTAALRERGIRMIATSSHRGDAVGDADLRGATALFVGNEGAGLARDVMAQMDEVVTIPHSTKVESLNAGVAASVLLYEAARQRAAETALAD